MATRPKQKKSRHALKSPRDAEPSSTTSGKAIDDADMREIAEKVDEAYRKERDNISEAYEDLDFRAGNQWPEWAIKRREHQKRPIQTFNQVPQYVRQITGDIRLMKPAIKAVPIDARASEIVAKLISGMIRYIENRSFGKIAYAAAADGQVAAGIGHLRVTTEYAEETTFNQEIRIGHVQDGVGVLWDPDAVLPTREDAMWCLVPVDMSRSKFKKNYPDVPVEEIASHDKQYTQYWLGADTVRVGEFWEKRPAKRRLALYPNGVVHDLTDAPDGAEERCVSEGAEIRERDGFKVYRSLVTLGHELEAAEVWPGRYIPIVPVIGEEVHIGRKIVRHGVIRFLKDPQRAYNYTRSTQTEVHGLAPKAPWLGTSKNFEEARDQWETANEENWPYLEYTPDPANGNAPPQRVQPPMASSALSEAVSLSALDMQRVTGIYNSSLGAKSNESSGIAIRARENQTDVGNVVYIDNFSLSVAHIGKIIVDLTPHVYDTERMVQIQDEDGTVRSVTINKALVSDKLGGDPQPVDEDDYGQPDDARSDDLDDEDSAGDGKLVDDEETDKAKYGADDDSVIDIDPQGTKQDNVSPDLDTGEAYENDVTIGSYGIVFDMGPAYATKREEAKEGMGELIKAVPNIAPFIIDMYVKGQDWPMAAAIADRLQLMLPPPIRAMIEAEKARQEGKPPPMMPPGMPPPGAPPMPPPPPPPNPAQIAEMNAGVAKANAATETARLNVETKAIERDIAALELRMKTAEAQGAGMSNNVVQGLVEEVASLHGMISQIVAMIGPQGQQPDPSAPPDPGAQAAPSPGGAPAAPPPGPVMPNNPGAPAPSQEGGTQ